MNNTLHLELIFKSAADKSKKISLQAAGYNPD